MKKIKVLNMKKIIIPLFLLPPSVAVADGLMVSFQESVTLEGEYTKSVTTGKVYLPYTPTGDDERFVIKGKSYKLLNRHGECNYNATFAPNTRGGNYVFTITGTMPDGCTQPGVVPEDPQVIWYGHIEIEDNSCSYPIELRESLAGDNSAWLSTSSTNSANSECRNIVLAPGIYDVTVSGDLDLMALTARSSERPSIIDGTITESPSSKDFTFSGQTISGYVSGDPQVHTYTISGDFKTLQ